MRGPVQTRAAASNLTAANLSRSLKHRSALAKIWTESKDFLRPNVEKYLGGVNFAGARVLEIGTANGFVCFEMEKRGADVVAFDLAEDFTYDNLPLGQEYIRPEAYRDGLRRIRNAYWLAHKRLGSKAQVGYGHANHLPDELGSFDIGIVANVLQHLENPVGAIARLARCSNVAIITETDWFHGQYDDLNGMIYFDKENPFVWYQVKPRLVQSVLRRMGFKRFERTDHTQFFATSSEHKPGCGPVGVETRVNVPHFTVVAYREAQLVGQVCADVKASFWGS